MVNRISAAIAKARARSEGAQTPGGRVSRLPLPAADEAWAGLPVHVTNARHLARNRIVTLEAGDAAMPFDVLRTRMLKEMRSHGWRRIAITSPDAGCGKSTLAANLALSLARQTELRSVLIELDLRRPSLAGLFGVARPAQFARALTGEIEAVEALQRIGPNLALGLNARAVKGATELLQAPGVAGMLDRMERLLGPAVMLFDLPPMLRGDDTLAFLDKVDCGLLVVEAEVTPIQDVDRCEQELARGTTVLGVVLNKLRHVEASYGYGRGYGYG